VGFEPTASTSRTWRSSQAEPQPVKKKRRLDRPKGEVNRRFLKIGDYRTKNDLQTEFWNRKFKIRRLQRLRPGL
jgi:hypothetical protein